MKRLTFIIALFSPASYSIAQTTFTVNSIGDENDSDLGDDICNDGSANCTLRAAIEQANATAGSDIIHFNIPGVGPHTITPASALPLIKEQLFIDGTTDPDFNGTPIIELDGSLTSGANGLWISTNADNSTIRGLVINGFADEAGIHLGASSGHNIQGNYLGTDVSGNQAIPNKLGIWILNNSSNNTIGGTSASAGNLISGNGESGVKIETGSTNNVIQGNIIGLNLDGVLIIPNEIDGIQIYSSDNTIGGSEDGARNIISGNTFSGIAMFEQATGNLVHGNYLGTDITGSIDLGNNTMGVFITGPENHIGGTESGEGNVISGNNQSGIWIIAGGEGTVVEGNFIGIDVTGNTSLPNTNDGIKIENSPNNKIGGTLPTSRNVIAGNHINISIIGTGSTGNILRGNFIGINASGTLVLGSSEHGILVVHAPDNIIGGSSAEARNIIYGSLFITEAEATGNKVEGNFIGTDVTGMVGLNYMGPGINVHKGGNNIIVGNVIAANTTGINFDGTSNNFVHGNYIGTNADGTSALGNSEEGIRIGGGSASNIIGSDGDGVNDVDERNIISGNSASGIFITDDGSDQNMIKGNYIGTDITGASAISNGADGVVISTQLNQIGGIKEDEGNLISGNGEDGIRLLSTSASNTVQGNIIGLDQTGANSVQNGNDGIGIYSSDNVIGGNVDGARNIISGNTGYGILIQGEGSDNNRVSGNYIGTDISGTDTIPNNQGVGLWQLAKFNIIGTDGDGISDEMEGNLISGNSLNGIEVSNDAEQNVIAGNLIGTDVSGIFAVPNAHGGNAAGIVIANGSRKNLIGTNGDGVSDELERNIISGNEGSGIDLYNSGDENKITGNYIGIDITGSTGLGNSTSGITIFGNSGSNVIGGIIETERNVISANGENGIEMKNNAINNIIIGNYIGTTADSLGNLGNIMSGINMQNGATGNTVQYNTIAFNNISGVTIKHDANSNIIGGNEPLDGNTISNNGDGILLKDMVVNNQIMYNNFSNNSGLPIDLNADGVTANDPLDVDTGPNQLQNFPLLSKLDIEDTEIKVTYWVDSDSASSKYPLLVQFYKSDSSTNSKEYLRTDTFKIADFNNGGKIFDFEFSANLLNGDYIISTATDNDGNTSEFSPKISIGPEIELSSMSLEFGEVTTEESKQETLLISNPGNGNLIISDISSDNNLFTADVTALSISPGENANVNITFTPDLVLEESGILTLQSNLDPIQISLSGIGIEPLGLREISLDLALNIYPNPFDSKVFIELELSKPYHLTIVIYDLLGQQVRLLLNQNPAAGFYHITWDGDNDLNSRVGSGIYLITIFVDGKFESTHKVSLR